MELPLSCCDYNAKSCFFDPALEKDNDNKTNNDTNKKGVITDYTPPTKTTISTNTNKNTTTSTPIPFLSRSYMVGCMQALDNDLYHGWYPSLLHIFVTLYFNSVRIWRRGGLKGRAGLRYYGEGFFVGVWFLYWGKL